MSWTISGAEEEPHLEDSSMQSSKQHSKPKVHHKGASRNEEPTTLDSARFPASENRA